MDETVVLNPVNEHYLDRVVHVAETQGVEASEDIYSANGIKLVAKGAHISPEVRERLIVHKLKKPLEQCIRVQNGTDTQRLYTEAKALFEQSDRLRALFAQGSILSMVHEIPLRPATLGLLDVAAAQDKHGLQHYLLVMLIALALAQRMRCGADIMRTVTMAGLMHDIGELYIERRYLEDDSSELDELDWRKIAAHPIIGQKLAQDICGMPLAVGQAILEHHERASGAGYPRGVSGQHLSLAGQIVAVAEMMAAHAERDAHPLQRVALVVKLLPGEYNPALVGALMELTEIDESVAAPPAELSGMMLDTLLQQLQSISMLLSASSSLPALRRGEGEQVLQLAQQRFQVLYSALHDTGVDMLCGLDGNCAAGLTEQPIMLRHEVDVVQHEVRWLLKSLSRELGVRVLGLPKPVANALRPLIEALALE